MVHVTDSPGVGAAVAHVVRSAPATVRSAEQEKLVGELAEIGAKIVIASVGVGELYFQAAKLIRTKCIAKALVTDTLEPLGFIKQRITELYRVATAADEVWQEYEARRLGFKAALNITRGTLKLLMSPTEQQARSGWLESIPSEGTEEGDGPSDGKPMSAAASGVTADKAPVDKKGLLDNAVARVARLAEDLNLRTKSFKLENGYTVKVWRGRAVGVKPEHRDQFPDKKSE